MPLRDNFRNPLKDFCPWKSFQAMWGIKMVERLNESLLSDRFIAHSERPATDVEIDVATLERAGYEVLSGANGHSDGGAATAIKAYAPATPSLSSEVSFSSSELFEVKLYRGGGGWNLVAAIELVSESNKDRGESREAFAIKCASYLQSGVSVIVLDIVTTRSAEFHNDICELLNADDAIHWSSPTGMSTSAYRVVRNKKQVRLDAWPTSLTVGEALPTLPLWLAADLAVPLELELTYEAACKSLRIR